MKTLALASTESPFHPECSHTYWVISETQGSFNSVKKLANYLLVLMKKKSQRNVKWPGRLRASWIMSFAQSETAYRVLNSANPISGQNERKAITWALGYEPEKRKSLEGFVCMGSTSKPAQDGKLFLGYGKR